MNLCGYVRESITEGEGLRGVVYISGCRHACQGCFNQEAWDFDYGEPFSEDRQREVITEIAENPLLDGLTLCGGDPFFSALECIQFVKRFRSACPQKSVWVYTGFTFEELMSNPQQRELAALCDVIVDGRFVASEKDTSLRFRGSRNQRIVDVAKSLETGTVVVKVS